ncbi:MAG: hypothetical protein EOO88_48070, partial [Pedobacter sp.]
MPEQPVLTYQGIMFSVLFMLGYAIYRLAGIKPASPPLIAQDKIDGRMFRKVSITKFFLILLGIVRLAFSLNTIYTAGFSGFYAGDSMTDTISSYGSESVSGGIDTILINFFNFATTSIVALYVVTC